MGNYKSIHTYGRDEIIINEAESVKKSYPNFWEDFEKMGGTIEKLK